MSSLFTAPYPACITAFRFSERIAHVALIGALVLSNSASAAEAPLAGRVVPELGAPAFREVIERSYRIIYRVEESSILVLAVLEGHRLLPEIDPEDGR